MRLALEKKRYLNEFDVHELEEMLLRQHLVMSFEDHLQFIQETKDQNLDKEGLKELRLWVEHKETFKTFIIMEAIYEGESFLDLVKRWGEDLENHLIEIMQEMWEGFWEKRNEKNT